MVLPGSASVLRPGAGTQLVPSSSSRDLPLPSGLAGGRSAAAAAAAAAGGSSSFLPEASGSGSGGGAAASRAQKTGFSAKLDTMARLCELASTVTAVDHPMCLDCAAQLKDEVQKQLEELNAEIAAYSDAVKRLEAESPAAVPQVGGSGVRREYTPGGCAAGQHTRVSLGWTWVLKYVQEATLCSSNTGSLQHRHVCARHAHCVAATPGGLSPAVVPLCFSCAGCF